jgi:hypothetical protein
MQDLVLHIISLKECPLNRLLLVLALSALTALCGLGCGGGNSSAGANGPVTSTPTTSNGLVFTISTPQKTYTRGAAVPVTFTIANTETQAANLTFAACTEFQVQVHQGMQQIWTGPDLGCGGITRSILIEAGATKTYTVTWDQKDSVSGSVVPPGTYTLTAKFTPAILNGTVLESPQLASFTSNPISITIAP